MILTKDQLIDCVPLATPIVIAMYLPLFAKYLPAAHIDTPARLAGFISQTAYESVNFGITTEMDSGSAYEGRINLGNTEPGDGVKYKGRGLIQCTGKGNYRWCSESLYGDPLVLVNDPDLLAQPDGAVRSAVWYWTVARNMNAICDQPETYTHTWNGRVYSKVGWLTVEVNGGLNGITGRTVNYQRCCKVLGVK